MFLCETMVTRTLKYTLLFKTSCSHEMSTFHWSVLCVFLGEGKRRRLHWGHQSIHESRIASKSSSPGFQQRGRTIVIRFLYLAWRSFYINKCIKVSMMRMLSWIKPWPCIYLQDLLSNLELIGRIAAALLKAELYERVSSLY